jgi:hypothetical protein
VLRDDPANEKYFRLWGKKGSIAAVAKPEKIEEGKREIDIAEVLRAHSEGNKLDPRVMTLLQSTAQGRDALAGKLAEVSANTSPDLLAIIKALKDLSPPQPPAPAKSEALTIVEALRGMQPPHQDMLAVLTAAKGLFTPGGESSRIAVLRELMEFSHVLMRGTSQRNGWDAALDAARDVALPVVQTVGNIIVQSMALRQGQPVPGTSATPPAPTAWDPYRNQIPSSAG